MNEGEASVKIYKCPKCVRKFTRKGLGVHFTKIHRLKLEDMYLDKEIDQAEVKVEKRQGNKKKGKCSEGVVLCAIKLADVDTG